MEVNSSLSSQLKCHEQSRRGRGLAVNRQEGIDVMSVPVKSISVGYE